MTSLDQNVYQALSKRFSGQAGRLFIEGFDAAFSADGWFVTGDFGRVDERGYVTVLGRGADLIISGGFNVYPKEVETCLNRLPNVAESAVIGVPHRDYGEAVVAVNPFMPGPRTRRAQINRTAASSHWQARLQAPKMETPFIGIR